VKSITKDILLLIKIISNLHQYDNTDLRALYKILKLLSKHCPAFIQENIQQIFDAILLNLNKDSDCAIVYALKLIRTLIKDKINYKKLISFSLIKELFMYACSSKFILSSEMFKLLISMINDAKLSQKIFEGCLFNYKQEFCDLIVQMLKTNKQQENYFVKRDMLKLVLALLSNCDFFGNFKEFFLAKIENLKIVMSLLNHTCFRIKLKALNVLFYFFVDLEMKTEMIRCLLKANKVNFENYFCKIEEECLNDADTMEKKNYILYELERLQNIC